jgi:tetratricopeptide (TPR) repeat protein
LAASLRAARQPLWAEGLLLGVVIAGWWLYRGRDFGDFLAVGMGLVAGAIVVGAVSPERLFRRRWLARSPRRRRRVRMVLAGLGCYLLLGMAGQGVARATLSSALQSAAAGRPHRALVAMRAGAAASAFFRPFTFYLDDFSARSVPVADTIYERANHDLEAGRWSQAEALYRAVLAVEPDRAQAYGNLGTCLYKQGHYWAAARCYLRVLDTDPNDMIALYHLAMTRTRLGQTDDAVDLIRRILFVDAQGSMYSLIDRNTELVPLRRSPAYRRLLAVYRRTHPHLPPEEAP